MFKYMQGRLQLIKQKYNIKNSKMTSKLYRIMCYCIRDKPGNWKAAPCSKDR